MPAPTFKRTLHLKRTMIIEKIKAHAKFLKTNAEKLDIYEGNLLPYIDTIMKESLSPQYYNAIKDRILPINILQRYVEKVSVAYSDGGPKRMVKNDKDVLAKEFLDFYSKQFNLNTSGNIADAYAAMFKGYAWEPYLDDSGKPQIRELPFDRFLVISDSVTNPEHGNIFVKILGNVNDVNGTCLIFAYTDTEFDAFYMSGLMAIEYLRDNMGENLVGTIPFVYGKRQKNKLIPTQDTDILAFTKSIPVMLSDAAGAQMFQCFTILYGIDVQFDNIKMSPNAIWSLKSDLQSDKTPVVGTLNPSADTEKVIKFVITAFVLWLETKGIRVGSIGSVDANSLASGISKIIDEMDVNKLVNKSMDWFEVDEHVLWNEKLPAIHKYWIESGELQIADSCPIVEFPEIQVEFKRPEPMVPRSQQIADAKSELELGTVEFADVLKELHPGYDSAKTKRLLDAHESKKSQQQTDLNNATNKNDNTNPAFVKTEPA